MDKTRLILWVAILASLVAFLDGSIVNVALPAMAAELGGGFVTQQWIIDAYFITMGALMLIAGSLSDIFGRIKIMQLGLWGFGLASVLCFVAPTSEFLIVSRALQGVAGALLVPSSLAMIMTYVPQPKRAQTIGSWSAWTGIAFLIGPALGGILVDSGTWRDIFIINLIPIAGTLILLKYLKRTHADTKSGHLDVAGAVLSTAGLGGIVYALIEQGRLGWLNPFVISALVIGVVFMALFLAHENKTKFPMLPLGLFKERNFLVGNITTLGFYGALAVAPMVLTIFLQQVAGYSATASGIALIPETIVIMLLSSKFGAMSGRFGPRLFMTFGPIITGLALIAILAIDESANYFILLPGILIFGFGMAMTIAPLTAAVLSSISEKQAGIASGVNNAVARIAALLAVAGIGIVVGQEITLSSLKLALIISAVVFAISGFISFFGIQNLKPKLKPRP